VAAVEGELMVDVTRTLARYVANVRWDDIPATVRREARRSLVNYFATAIGGSREPAMDIAVRTLGRFGGPATASLVGRSERLDPFGAAFVNAAGANVFDFDDTHPATILHPTAPVAPALFALAETFGLSGRDLLCAFIVGAEAECRIANAVSPGHYRRGWHITSTCGVFGAAIGVAKSLALGEAQVASAIANAAAQTGGTVEALGTMSKSIGVGNAARNGLLAALLARDGFSGPPRPLEGERGFLRLATDAPRFDEVCDGLGQRWELLTNTYKPYPCGVVLNPVLEACLALARDPRLVVDAIERIDIVGHPLLRERTDRPGVRTGREAQVSAQHAVAVSLARGRAGLAEFSDAAVADTGLRALGTKVRFTDDERLAVDSARVTLHLHHGATLERFVEHAYGGERRPMTDADLEAKLRDLIAYAGAAIDPVPLVDALHALDEAPDAASVMALARSHARQEGRAP
jgi:2-methylcitrate dehydratase PrpD